jgi:hypothetical protein
MALTEKTSLADMLVGDKISCKYTATSGKCGMFSELGKCEAEEIPVTGTATPNGKFFFIKTATGLCISDRVLQTNITWETLRAGGFIEGYDMSNITNQSYYISSGSYSNRTLAFDRIVGNYTTNTWESASADGKGWVGQNFGMDNKKKIIAYAISACTDYQQNSPIDWNFDASHNGTTWITLDEQRGYTEWASGQRRYFTIDNDEYYQYYRVNILNAAGSKYAMISELEMYETTDKMLIRSLTGGCAYKDSNGNVSMTNSNNGIYPSENEFCKYLLNSTLNGNITVGDNSVWNMDVLSFTQNTPRIGTFTSSIGGTMVVTNANRITRGNNTNWGTFGIITTTTLNATVGFRPILQYIEPNGSSKQTNHFY